MMASSNIHFSMWLVLVYLFTVSALPASRNFTVVKLFPSPIQKKDAGSISVPLETGNGVMADQRSAFLGKKADVFRFHQPGFEHVPGSVALESATHPGLYLRYKNYKFHLEKTNPSGVFEKDATFIERKTQTKGAAAYELFNHPGWFMCHDTKSTFGLVAKQLEIGSNDFLVGCLYMAVAQEPTKKALLVMKDEDAATRGNIHNFTGITSNDVSAENLMKQHLGNVSTSQVNKTSEHVLSKINGTASNDESRSKLPSNSTAGKNSTAAKTMDKVSVYKTVENSTKPMAQSNATEQLQDDKKLEDAHVANATLKTQKPTIDLQNKTNVLAGAAQVKKQLLQNDKYKVDDLAANNGNQNTTATQKNQDSESADQGSATQQLLNTLQGAFKVAKQPVQTGITTAKNPNLGKGIGFAEGRLNQQQKDKNGLHSPSAPKKAANGNGPNGFNFHLEFPSSPKQKGTFHETMNASPGPAQFSLPGKLAQITAKALGFVQNAVQNHQRQKQQQLAPQYTKGGVGFPFQQQQQQQPFHRPLPYFNQQMRPQASFRAPNFITVPKHVASARPLLNQFAVKSPAHSQFAYKQAPMSSRGYGYQNPVKGWRGMVSIGKQSLVGNRTKFQDSAQVKQNLEAKTSGKLDDNSKIPDKHDKCISLKFMNKVRKPIQLVSSMKLGGYLITAETFKLKTIFKHPRKHHHVIFYARDADDKDNEVMLNNNNAIAVTPGGCDLPFRSVLLSHHGQISNDEIEHIREKDEYATSMEAAQKSVHSKGDENFSQWTAFGPCGTTCGRSIQSRTRSCIPGKLCQGPAVETRTCIQTPCPVTPCLKTYGGKCCALPFVYHGAVVNRCLVDPQTRRSWCATTPNFDKEKRWGYCQPSGPHTEQIAPVQRSFLPGSPRQQQPLLGQCSETCARICMSWCPRHCCVTAKHR